MIVQAVRLIDVFWLGPFLLMVSQRGRLDPTTRKLLAISGLATILFNAARFVQQRGGATD